MSVAVLTRTPSAVALVPRNVISPVARRSPLTVIPLDRSVVVSTVLSRVIAPLTLMAPPAVIAPPLDLATSCTPEPVDEVLSVMAAKVMACLEPLVLSSVKVGAWPEPVTLKASAALCVMLPLASTVTSLPALMAPSMSVVLIVVTPGSFRALASEPPVEPSAVMVTSVGSSNHKPLRPIGAWVDTLMPSTRNRRPEVSMRPPSPPLRPPSARRVPPTEVTPVGWPKSLQATTVPPLPLLVALASSTAPDSTVVLRA